MSFSPVSRSSVSHSATYSIANPIQVKKSHPNWDVGIGVQDTLLMQSQATSWIHDSWNQILGCLKKIWDSLCFCFGTKKSSEIFTSTPALVINPSQHPQNISNPNKLFVYNQLVRSHVVGDRIVAQKFSLSKPELLKSAALFTSPKPHTAIVSGGFRYDPSSADTSHWTANFADSHLFGFCEGPLLAQDELQVLEHPALAHVKNALPPEMRRLNLYDAALFQNVPRFGSLDTTTPFLDGRTLYGNNFSAAAQSDILARLHPLASPTSSNIFAIAAPHISRALKDQPYQKSDLQTLFLTAYNAFHGIKEVSSGKKIVIHTGNWGAGAFGNDPKTVYILQLAAARFAGIDEIRMHPMNEHNQLTAASLLLDQIEVQFPQMTIEQFLDHLAANAASYGLKYKEGNGT